MADIPRAPTGFVEAMKVAERLVQLHQLDIGDARQIVVDAIHTGVPTRIVEIDGTQRPASPAELDDELIWSTGHHPILAWGETDGGHSIFEAITRTLEISAPEALSYAARALGVPAETGADAARDRGGRRPTHEWMEAQAQVIQRVWQHDLPGSKDQLTRELLDWFERASTAAPDRRTIERKIAEWWPLLERLAAISSTELRPEPHR